MLADIPNPDQLRGHWILPDPAASAPAVTLSRENLASRFTAIPIVWQGQKPPEVAERLRDNAQRLSDRSFFWFLISFLTNVCWTAGWQISKNPIPRPSGMACRLHVANLRLRPQSRWTSSSDSGFWGLQQPSTSTTFASGWANSMPPRRHRPLRAALSGLFQ